MIQRETHTNEMKGIERKHNYHQTMLVFYELLLLLLLLRQIIIIFKSKGKEFHLTFPAINALRIPNRTCQMAVHVLYVISLKATHFTGKKCSSTFFLNFFFSFVGL